MISTGYSEAFVEVLAILDNTPIEEKQGIPQKFINFLKENASPNYKISFDKNKQIEELTLKKETKAMLSVIYYNYLCPKDQKEEYIEILNNNQTKFEEELREKYNPDNIFKNNTTAEPVQQQKAETVAMTEYKESFFTKIINKIKAIFHK